MTVSRTLVREVTDRLAERLAEAIEVDSRTPMAARHGDLRNDRQRLELLMGQWLSDEVARVDQQRLQRGDPMLDPGADQELRAQAFAEVLGAGPLQPYMDDSEVEEIDVNSHRCTWISYTDGRKVDIGQLWDDVDELVAFQRRLTLTMGVTEGRLDEQSPMVTLQAGDGSRVVMVLGGPGRSGVSTQPRIAIRRFTVERVGLHGLADRGLLPHDVVPCLEGIVRAGMTVLVSGGPGAGKTTLLKELLGAVPPGERIVTIEKGLLELRLEDDPRHPDAPALFTRQANTEGRGEVSARQLVELTRRLNPDRVVVGELVEDEALEMLDVASMCKRGSMATIHAHTAEAVLPRLAFYVAKSDTRLPEFAVWSLIAQTVDFVIHIDLVRNVGEQAPRRRVTSILELGGRGEHSGVRTTEVWGLDRTGRLVQQHPLNEQHLVRIRRAGVDESLFVPGVGAGLASVGFR
jgi:Flp pilus assembly CpaF family ATPase